MSHPLYLTNGLQADISSLTVTSTVYHMDSSVTLREIPDVEQEEKTEEPAPYSIFTKNQKLAITIAVSLSAFFTAFSTNIYFPALRVIQQDLQTTEQLISLTVTMYMILQGISPSFWGAIADTWGRRPVYIVTLFVYSLASVGAGCSQNYPMLLVMRMLQAVGSSSSIAVGAGTIGDISTPAERGGYMGIYSMLTQLGPVAGPFLGELNYLRFVTLLISFIVLFIPETLRSLVGDGSGYANPTPLQYFGKRIKNQELEPNTDSRLDSIITIKNDLNSPEVVKNTQENKIKKRGSINIFQSLSYLKEKDIAILLFYYSLQYGTIHSMLSSLTKLFTENYHLNTLQIGLCYLASGIGASLGSYSSGSILNWQFARYSDTFFNGLGQVERNTSGRNLDSGFPIEAARLNLTGIWGIVFTLFTLAYGWCMEFRVHIAAPLVMTFFMNFSSCYTFCTINTLLVDLFPDNSAAIIASNNFTRCILGAIAVFCVNPGVEAIGAGWFFTIIALLVLLSGVIIVVELKFGPKWRLQRLERVMKRPLF
ncbi:hypothetical protein G6F57_002539 [Rhizopus arrhizus]|uniref:Major facilitator superfamily (MFS) profile domain-containing protein n=1 Tax=Rhizopus oryzae TaxID=64495 RepID=A0A9P7BW57_RHIOR|nr:hypothetical protein G6F23_001995 [Rhizopus arrhizus]KAG1420567.1 hypothetical protein G6F58_004122 [Rhizopus delemar]KAG0768214.1 hypothetical protein G6F24_002133 [Rhizopus arrhizus]KAG0794824.1 hypothetical protein G6F21_002575 [Rhizopus arrhizus]KAG0800125.1 hypothetical protein G6F22_002546 [Rhizopus arrhizus]